MQPSGEGLTEDFIIQVQSLDLATGSQPVYVSFTRTNPDEYTLGSFSCTLKFVSKEVDPASGLPEDNGYPDEYELEEVELSAGGDYIIPSYCSFESEWSKLEGEAEGEEEFALSSMESIKGKLNILLILHLCSRDPLPISGMRFYHRGPEHGGPRWIRPSNLNSRSYTAPLGSRRWWRRQGFGKVSNGIYGEHRRLITHECESRKGRSCAVGHRCHRLMP